MAGCSYCNGEKWLVHNLKQCLNSEDYHGFKIDVDADEALLCVDAFPDRDFGITPALYIEIPINFCPKCGRRLKEDVNA